MATADSSQHPRSTQSFLVPGNPRQPAARRRSNHGTASLIAANSGLYGRILLAALRRHEFYNGRSELILGTCALPRHVYTKVNHAAADPLARVYSLIGLRVAEPARPRGIVSRNIIRVAGASFAAQSTWRRECTSTGAFLTPLATTDPLGIPVRRPRKV